MPESPSWSPTVPPQFTSFVGTELHQLRPDGSSYEFLGYINRADCDRIVRLLNQAPKPPTSGRYKTSNVSLNEGIDLIVEEAMSQIAIGTDGRCKTLRDFYTLMGTEEALRSLLGSGEKDAHDVIVDRFAEAAQSPEEKSAIFEGQLNRPLLLPLHYEHREAIRSVLINEVKRNTALVSEILAAAETGV